MKNIKKIHNKLKSSSIDKASDIFIEYCIALIDEYKNNKIDLQEVGIWIINGTREGVEAIGTLTPQIKITDEILDIAGSLDGYNYNCEKEAQEDLVKIEKLISKYQKLSNKN